MKLQNYLSQNKGENLKKIDPDLKLIEINHNTNNGSIDILCHKNLKPIGISFNEKQIQTHLLYMPAGEIYFIAPRIKKETYTSLKTYHTKKKLKFFEYTYSEGDYFFEEINEQKFTTPKTETIELITSTLIDMLPRKYSNIKKAYKLISHLK